MFEPTLVGSFAGHPSVQITFDALDAATSTVTVWRRADTLEIVPGTEGAFAAGGFVVEDHWAPHSIEVTYWAEMFDSSGASLGVTGSASTTVWGVRDEVVVSDPFDPENAVSVQMGSSFGSALGPKLDVETHIVGSRVVSLIGNHSLLQDVDLTLKTDTQEQADTLRSILNQGIVLFRLAPYVRPQFPTVLYATVAWSVVDSAGLNGYEFGGESATWQITGVQNSAITVGAAVASTPWQLYVDAFATWQEMIDAYPTWLDAMRNPPNA